MSIVHETYTNGKLVASRVIEVPAATVNADAIRAKAKAALTANATFLAIGSPSAAQVAAQVKLLTRQVQALIRLTLVELDTDDT